MSFADRVLALAGYHRAVGLDGLERGLAAVRQDLVDRTLASRRVAIYPAGRADIEQGRIDSRVLVLLLYLGDRHGSVTVSSLQSGHGIFTKSGNLSNHTLGRAADISALGGVPIVGHQGPGGVTEQAPAEHPAAAEGGVAERADIAVRPRRPVVRHGRPRRPHPRGFLG